MKTLQEVVQRVEKGNTPAMRKWIISQVENTKRTHDAIKKDFVRKFGSKNAKYFDKVVNEIVN